MAGAVLLRAAGRLYLADPARGSCRALGGGHPLSHGALSSEEVAAVRAEVGRPGADPRVRSGDPRVSDALMAEGVAIDRAGLAELRAARELAPWPPFRAERAGLLALATRRFEEAVASDVETWIALAREEERLERARNREASAADQWIAPSAGPLADHATEWRTFRAALDRHHGGLVERLEAVARRTAPNLSEVVGPRVAGRLVATAGGLLPLARYPSARLQLLGARRRPGADRGPKYGVLAGAVQSADLPPSAWGAYARSLAALASIAARADATTHAPIAAALVARRERRRAELRRRRRA